MQPGRDGFGRTLFEARERMSPEQRERLDERLAKELRRSFERFAEMEKAVVAVGSVLHRDGVGERAGFCAECGQVMPCTSRRMLEPFLAQG